MPDLEIEPELPLESPPRASKRSVNYRDAEGGASCGVCRRFSSPNKCQLVQGEVSSEGLCDAFVSVEPMQEEVMEQLFGGAPVVPGGGPL